MKLGIVGLPNVGKSTLFNSITKAGAESANYPFCTIDPNVGVVSVPDERLDVLTKLTNSPKTVYAAIEFVDIAGLVKGASKGEGLGNQFLSNIREVDAIVHVVRCFDDTNVIHVDGSVDPIRDIETINLELLFSDIEILERKKAKLVHSVMGDKSLKKELDLVENLIKWMEDGNAAKKYETEDEDEIELIRSYNLLTYKPVIYAANVSEDDAADDGANNDYVKKVREYAAKEGSEVFALCAKLEEEISELDSDEEKKEFLEDLGMKESGLDKLIKASYKLLGLISFITTGDKETRAWTIKKGTLAPQAAGKIHSDFERGFIRAEVVSYDDFVKYKTIAAIREQGLLRSEGKEYVMKDGDVVEFRFNV
ncbi:MAG: redox-regulated ATPase YchF [Lachnospiraceae bacterium]|jgi:GTP-binding protein YchF|nr:redox-regulated ATPase YchF [Lachnospiraceae bacterium]